MIHLRRHRPLLPRHRVAIVALLVGVLAGCGASAQTQEQVEFEHPAVGVPRATLEVDAATDSLSITSQPDLQGLDDVVAIGPPEVRAQVEFLPQRHLLRVSATTADGRPGRLSSLRIVLDEEVPWTVHLAASASDADLELERLTKLSFLDVRGDIEKLEIRLPIPLGTVPVDVAGQHRTVTIHLQAVAARVVAGPQVGTLTVDGRATGIPRTRRSVDLDDVDRAHDRDVISLIGPIDDAVVDHVS